jgi:hypothetical protein
MDLAGRKLRALDKTYLYLSRELLREQQWGRCDVWPQTTCTSPIYHDHHNGSCGIKLRASDTTYLYVSRELLRKQQWGAVTYGHKQPAHHQFTTTTTMDLAVES